MDTFYRLIYNRRETYSGIGVAPHTVTVRAVKTLSSNETAKLKAACLWAKRNTEASTRGTITLTLEIITEEGYSAPLKIATITPDMSPQFVEWAGIYDHPLKPYSAVRILTSDASTGGTVDYNVTFVLAYYK